MLLGGGMMFLDEVEQSLVETCLEPAAREVTLAAFNRLALCYQDSLYRWVISLVNDEDLAEDLTQSTLAGIAC